MDRDHRPLDDTQPLERPIPADELTPPPPAGPGRRAGLSVSTLSVWLAIVVALVGFILLGRVTVHPDGFEREMRVVDVWREMAGELPDVNEPLYLKTLYVIAIAMTVLGAFAALWIALIARDPRAIQPRGAARQVDGASDSEPPGRDA